MTEQRNFYVPWPDLSEWETVRDQILSCRIDNVIKAYETILMWKLKYNSIPAYIESTHTLLQVMVKEYKMTQNENDSRLFNEYDMQLSYSTALIRFVNHVSSISSYKGETLYLAAKTQNIPDWIINMRHDAAHGQDLPSLDALHIAADLSLKWLLDNYWLNAEHCEEKQLDASTIDIDSEHFNRAESETQSFFKKAFEIWEICHDAKSKTVTFVAEMEREFVLHVEDMLTLGKVYFRDIENEAMDNIQRIVHMYNQTEENENYESEIMCRITEFQQLLLNSIKNIIKNHDQLQQSLIMSLLQTTFLSEKHFHPPKWNEVLCLLQELGSFSLLLQVLIQMAGKGHNGAAKWLSTLPPSLKLLRKQWAMFKVLKKENNNFKTKLLKKRVNKTTLKSSNRNLKIKLGIFKPPIINLEMMKSILLNPEQFAVKDIVEFLKLVKPPLMKSTIHMIRDLLNLHAMSETDKPENEATDARIYTVDDLHEALVQQENCPVEEAKNEDGWIKSSIDIHAWNKCPLGLLPFQSKVDCRLPEGLSWKKKSAGKRNSIPLVQHSENMKRITSE